VTKITLWTFWFQRNQIITHKPYIINFTFLFIYKREDYYYRNKQKLIININTFYCIRLLYNK